MAGRPSPESWAAISTLLDDALDLEPAARVRWLADLQTRDARAAAAVEAWLQEFDVMESRGFLLDRAAPAPAAAALAGMEVGSYRLVELIGQGGMGTVWQAERRDGQFDQRVAVKVLNAALMDTAGTERFSREAAILARLTHPSISRLIDAGVSSLGAPYLVLEYVDGEHIDTYCDRRRLSLTDRLYLFLDALAPVAHAHANLVVHRDLKPANVLVTSDGHVKLLDFGIAKLMHEDGHHPTVAATQGTALTPAFAAPEQLTGGDITTATDVYALGVLLYQLLTGRHPSLDGSATPAALVEAVLRTDPPRASVMAVRPALEGRPSSDELADARSTMPARLSAELAGDLDTILAKAVKKSPLERYATVAAFEDDLRRSLRHQPIAARPDTIRYRVAKFTRRHRAPVAFAAVALLALVAGLIGTITQARRATAQAARADQEAAEATSQRDFARRQLARADAINDLNAFLISDAAPAGSTFTARGLLTRAEQIVTRQGDDPNGTKIDSLISIGEMLGRLGETTRANTLLQQAYDAAVAQADPALKAQAACALGREVVKTGDIDRARRLIDEGLKAIPATAQYGLARAACHLDGSGTEIWADDGARAVAHVEAARTAAEAAGVVSPLMSLKLSMQLAESLRMADRPADANTAFADAYERLVALGREDTERAGTLLNNWGLLLGRLGRPLEAEKMLRRSIDVSIAGGSDARVEPISWSNLARSLVDLGRYAEAVPLAERAMRLARERGDAVVGDQSQLMAARANVLAGRIARGEALLDDVEARFRKMFPPNHQAFTAVATDRVRLAFERGDLDGAATLADQAVALMESEPRFQSSIPLALRLRAMVNNRRGRFAEALRDAERLKPLFVDTAPPGVRSAGVGGVYLAMGEGLAGLGRTAEARVALTEALRHLEDAAGKDHPSAKRARELLARL